VDQEHPDEAKRILNAEIKVRRRIVPQENANSLEAAEITYDPVSASLLKSAEDAYRIGS